jgi:hypothetical protein
MFPRGAFAAEHAGTARCGGPDRLGETAQLQHRAKLLQNPRGEKKAAGKRLMTPAESKLDLRAASAANPVETKRRAGNLGATLCIGAITGRNMKSL